jgi:transcriptional regulator with XRE-family HTH domain
MGRAPRMKPRRLAEKLLQIRNALGLSQSELISRLGVGEMVTQNRISTYEVGTHEPSLLVLLQYARAANVITDALIDDELDLPDQLPSPARHDGIKRKSVSRARAKR